MIQLYVKEDFRDKETKAIYEQGQIIEVTEERFDEIAENLGSKFVAKVIIEELDDIHIQSSEVAESEEETEEVVYPNHIGGGNYELSDGSKVKGKQAAIDAENTLSEE